MFCALIMAGGKGTRFWPKSTEEKPKQFLKLLGNKTMIQMTCERVEKVIPLERVFVVTCTKYVDLVKEQLPNISEKNIIIEPEGRNTAPCILLASLYIKQLYENANIAVLPSDHIINNTKDFCKILEKANKFLEKQNNAIVTIGIEPNRPETGYGYIKCSNEVQDKVIKVEKFVEKPNLSKAKKYLKEGNYLWNAGMFIFNVNSMLNELKENYKQGYEILSKLPKIDNEKYEEELKKKYKKCESISIDYAVMEKSESIYVIPASFGWDDIGTWTSLQRYVKPDQDKNFITGEVVTYNSSNNVIYGGDKKIVLLDVNNVFCIESDDVIIIGKKDKIKEVHEYREKI